MKAALIAASTGGLRDARKCARALSFEEGPVLPNVHAFEESPHRAEARLVIAIALPERDLERLLGEGLTVALEGRVIDPATEGGRGFLLGLTHSQKHRVRDGIAAVRTSERAWGRPSRFTAEEAALARELREQGLSWTRLARALGIPRTTARRLVRGRSP